MEEGSQKGNRRDITSARPKIGNCAQEKQSPRLSKVGNSPEALAMMIHARCQMIKNDDLDYRLDGKTAKKLSIQIAEIFKENYKDLLKDDYYDNVIKRLNAI